MDEKFNSISRSSPVKDLIQNLESLKSILGTFDPETPIDDLGGLIRSGFICIDGYSCSVNLAMIIDLKKERG